MILFFALLHFVLPVVGTATSCHNASGTCHPDGYFACMSNRASFQHNITHLPLREQLNHLATKGLVPSSIAGTIADSTFSFHHHVERIPWAQRCDGKEDCADGTDEVLCELPPNPPSGASSRPTFHAQFASSNCVACQCVFGAPILIDKGSEPLVPAHPWWKAALVARPSRNVRNVAPRELPCNPEFVYSMQLQLYKKNKLCKMAVCCVEQYSCYGCGGGGRVPQQKCYDFIVPPP